MRAKTSGEVKLGVRRLEFHDAGNADLSGFTWDARVEWSPKTYSRFSAYTTRAVSESAFLPGSASSSTATSDLYGMRWRHGLSERLTFDAAVERTVAAFEAGGEDRFLSLEERTAVANDARADLFVSIHANASRSRKPRGMETYFASLECELIDRQTFRTQAEARMAIFEYIEGWYNPHRRHSRLGYRSPVNYERSYQQAA